MDTVLLPLLAVIDIALSLYVWALIISAVLSWLVAFNVVNPHNQFVHMVGSALYQITEPALRPIRRMLPSGSGIDFSPIVLILAITFLRMFLARVAMQIG